jgi:4-hydroxy-tetrahydrodipicolinate synthase
MDFKGVFPILPTPFLADESVDLKSYGNIVQFMADVGVSGVTILGVLGEANRLTDSERESIIRTAVTAAAGKIPIVVGTSHSGTRATIALSQSAAELGASAIMVTPHQEPTPNESRIFDHFKGIGDAIDLPMVLQDHPGSTGVHMSLPLVLKMVEEIPTVACIKQEALPSPARVSGLITAMQSRRVPILTGLGALYGGFELFAGADGFMTGFAFPEVLMAMVSASTANDDARVWDLYQQFLPLMVFEGQPGVAVRKHLFALRGLMNSDTVRKPAGSISPHARAQLADVIDRVIGTQDITRPLRI